jgi:repressor LexA
MKILSPKQQKFLDFIHRFTAEQGHAPSYDEIMMGLGFKSLGTVNWYVKTLEAEGHLTRLKGSNGKRALSTIHELNTSVSARLPLLGLIAAGEPIEALEDTESIEVPSPFMHPDNFVLKVKGDSMIDEHIQDGDYIIVRKTPSAHSGQIVVALINGEATLKYYYPKSNGVELHPRNQSFPIIQVDKKDNFAINGILLYSFREY